MTSQLSNILRNAARPGYLLTMAQKLALRADDYLHRSDTSAVRRWCSSLAESAESYARSRDSSLWDEAEEFSERFQASATERLQGLGVALGGGGHYTLLYFLARWKRPSVVVETGVAAGFSSAAILTALELNGRGQLLSSDFPYFRLEQPERFIGCLVDDRFRSTWRLEIKGDRANLPRLLQGAGKVDLFHYDSDKSHYGRRWAMRYVEPKLSSDALILMDDIQDNWYFKEEVERRGGKFRIFEFNRKYLGLIELNA